MDTSILSTLFMIAPDLMEEVELRALILERISALGPIGRRALAQRLHLAEREIRSAADALKNAGCIIQSAAGMEITETGKSLVDTSRAVSRSRRSLASMELSLSQLLNVQRVCIVRGDADLDHTVLEEAARTAAQQLRFLLQDAQILAVSGGRTMAHVAQAVSLAAPLDITVVPAQGGVGGSMRTQANMIAETFAEKFGGQCRLLHLPEGVSPAVVQEFMNLPAVREAYELLTHADVLLYGIARAQDIARRRALNAGERDLLEKQGACCEMLGFYLNAQGQIAGMRSSIALRAQDIGTRIQAAAVAAGKSKAEAILAACLHHPHRLLVIDEGAAHKILELLRE